jgi:hypothetical protein
MDDLGLNPGLCNGRPATCLPSHGAAFLQIWNKNLFYLHNIKLRDMVIRKQSVWTESNTFKLSVWQVAFSASSEIQVTLIRRKFNSEAVLHSFYCIWIFALKLNDLHNTVFSFCIHSYSCIMAWWWSEFRVRSSRHVIKLFTVRVACDWKYW